MKNAQTENDPILDPKLQEQLRMEFYGINMTDDSLISSQTRGIGSNLTSGMLVIGASVVGLVGMQLPFLFIKHAPFMATPARKVRDALKFIDRKPNKLLPTSFSASSKFPSPRTFVDLGSGDGQAVYEAAKLGYKAIGIEFNWTLWALSSLRRFFWPSEVKRRSKFLLQDFSNYDLKGANTVMIFAVPRTMPVLGQKIQSECAHGTNIMAYRFEMPLATRNSNNSKNGEGKQAKKEESDQSSCMVPSNRSDEDEYENEDDEDLQLRANCIYNQEEMRIYRMGE